MTILTKLVPLIKQLCKTDKMEISYKYYTLELILRLFCGVIFFFQGYDKLFKVKISGVIETFRYEAQQKNIPGFALWFMAVYTSLAEFVCGLFLILGLFKNYALCLLGIDMVLVAAAFSYMKPVWDMKYVFPRLILIILLMAMPGRWSVFSLDFLIKNLIQK